MHRASLYNFEVHASWEGRTPPAGLIVNLGRMHTHHMHCTESLADDDDSIVRRDGIRDLLPAMFLAAS